MSKSTKATKKSTLRTAKKLFALELKNKSERVVVDEDAMQELMITNLYDKNMDDKFVSDIMSDCDTDEYDLLYDGVVDIITEFFESKGYTSFSYGELVENSYTFLKGETLKEYIHDVSVSENSWEKFTS